MTKNPETVDVGPKIDAQTLKEMENPEHISSVIDRLLAEAPEQFPVYNVYAVYDLAVQAHIDRFDAVNDMVAFRDFRTRLLKGETRYLDAPEQYLLRYIGQWELVSGDLVPDEHRDIATVLEILEHAQAERES